MEVLSALRNRLEELRKSGKIPYWRFAFADFLIERANEYRVLSRTAEARETLLRLEKWITQSEETVKQTPPVQISEISYWKTPHLEQMQNLIQETLELKRHLIPAPERETFLRRLEKITPLIQSGTLKEAYEELIGIRSDLISRLYRSYRARGAFLPGDGTFQHPHPEIGTGLYNTLHTLESTLSLVGERDPIWVEDFLELYNQLMKITDRLAPVEKKR
ncbi:MAG: hypothetical protein LBR60_01080 [Fibrobacter sp.]|jgi:hypothetical protein|nr:hypothetical protein [Fibrobacter sp.]